MKFQDLISRSTSSYLLVLFLIGVHLLLLSKLQFTAWPEMLSYPYLLNKGFRIYSDFVHPYEPLLTFILAPIYRLFSYAPQTLIVFTYGIIVSIDILIFLICKKITSNALQALIPLCAFILFQPVLDGNMLWFDLATVPFILLGIFFYLSLREIKWKFFSLGLCWALAVLVKQQVGLLFIFLGIYLLFTKKRFQKISWMILGAIIPAMLVSFILLVGGVFKDYIFWTITFPLVWLPKFQGYTQLPTTSQILISVFIFGSCLLPVFASLKNVTSLQKLLLVTLLAAITLSFPRFSFFHLQLALAIAILLVTTHLKENSLLQCLSLSFLVFAVVILWRHQTFTPQEIRFYATEDKTLAQLIQTKTASQDGIYLLGPYSSEYVISDRLPPKPWVDNFNWYFEISGEQDQFIKGMKKYIPKVVLVQKPLAGASYQIGVYQPKQVLDYIENNYQDGGPITPQIELWIRKS